MAKSFTRFLPAAARIVMGLMFFVFGLNGFLHFIPEPKTPIDRIPVEVDDHHARAFA